MTAAVLQMMVLFELSVVMPLCITSVFFPFPPWRWPWVCGHRAGRDMCWGLSRAPLSPPTRGKLGRGGVESEAAEGSGACGGFVSLKASPQQKRSFLLLPVPCWEGTSVLGTRPWWHHLQRHPAAVAARRQRPVQLPAAYAWQVRQHHQSRETSVLCFCARWVMSQRDLITRLLKVVVEQSCMLYNLCTQTSNKLTWCVTGVSKLTPQPTKMFSLLKIDSPPHWPWWSQAYLDSILLTLNGQRWNVTAHWLAEGATIWSDFNFY